MSRRDRESLSEDPSWIPPGSPGGIGRSSQRSRRDREAILVNREGSGGHPEVLAGVGKPSRRSGRPSRISRSLGGPHSGPSGFRRPTQGSRWVWEAISVVREGLGGPPGG